MNEADKSHKLKESIRMLKSDKSDIKRGKLIKDGRKWKLIKLLSKMKSLNLRYRHLDTLPQKIQKTIFVYTYIKWTE